MMFSLAPALSRPPALAAELPFGQQRLLEIARALATRPRLLLLDEPSLGLAPLIAREIFATISRLRERGTAVLLVEQNARAALRLATRGCVLEVGRLALAGSVAELLADPRVQAAYLGA